MPARKTLNASEQGTYLTFSYHDKQMLGGLSTLTRPFSRKCPTHRVYIMVPPSLLGVAAWTWGGETAQLWLGQTWGLSQEVEWRQTPTLSLQDVGKGRSCKTRQIMTRCASKPRKSVRKECGRHAAKNRHEKPSKESGENRQRILKFTVPGAGHGRHDPSSAKDAAWDSPSSLNNFPFSLSCTSLAWSRIIPNVTKCY